MRILGKIMIVGVLALLPLQVSAAAAPKGKCFTKSDTDCDGMINEKEWLANAKKHFDETDANRDGKVTREEMKALREKHRAERAARMGMGQAPAAAKAAAPAKK
jgi:hypothetical protein